MIVFCEECGEKHIIDPDKLDPNVPTRCHNCGDILRVFPTSSSQPLMELKFGDKIIEINHTRTTVTMGRKTHNDLAVKGNCVSRTHARVEFRRNQFILIDQSTNGTFVLQEGKQGFNLRRDELPLSGKGILGLGMKVEIDSPEAIHFLIK